MDFLRFEEFLNENRLNEIGEGSRPFSWRRIGPIKLESWMADLSQVDKADTRPVWTQLPGIQYGFQSDKAEYVVRIAGGWQRYVYIPAFSKPGSRKPQDYNLIIVASFDIKTKDPSVEGEPITNFGEQFRVVSTVIEIIENLVRDIEEWEWVKLQEIRLAPKLESNEEGKPITQTKRGRLYFEYIKKQGRRLPGDWTVEIGSDMFIIKRGKWMGGDKFHQL